MSHSEEEMAEINDIREANVFKGITFSEFKKTDVIKEFIKSLLEGKLEPACYWCAELICAGHYLDLWDAIIIFFSKYIHIGNPKLVHYIDLRCTQFKNILKNGYIGQEIRLRNHRLIRKLFAEICIILNYSKKKHPLSEVKIKQEELETSEYYYKYKAPDLSYADDYLMDEDLKDIIVPLNEFTYHLAVDGSSVDACYWLEWLVEFEKKCRAQHIAILGRRNLSEVESKYQKDMAFCIWSIILGESCKRGELVKRTIKSSFQLFCLKYTSGCFKKRKFLLYFSIEMLTTHIATFPPIMEDKSKIEQLISNLNIIYKQIKKNEISPGTDYLFNQDNNNNLEKTIEKLDTMRELQDVFIPRIEK